MEDKKSIEINTQLEFNDFWQVLFWQVIKRFWLMYVTTLILTIPMMAVYFYALINNSDKTKFSPAIVFPLLPLITVLLTQWSAYSGAKRSAASVRGKTLWIFSEDGYEVCSSISRSENSWESLLKVEETSKTFLLFLQKSVFMLIPKRFFDNQTQMQKFRELVCEKLGDKAKLKND